MTRHPLRRVVGGWDGAAEPMEMSGRGSVLGPDTSRRTRWWELRLECGHEVERTVRYSKRPGPAARYSRARSGSDVLPAPKRVRCELCPRAES